MRILVVSNLFTPDHAGGAAVYSDLCVELAARGHDVTVRCAYPYFPEWTDRSGQNGWRIRRSTIAGVKVERHGMFIPRRPSSVAQRMLYESSFLASLSRRLYDDSDADVVLTFSTMLSPVVFAVAVSHLHRAPLLINVQDLSSGGAAAAQLVGGRIARTLGAIERRLFKSADGLSSISPEMVTTLDEMVDGTVPVEYVPNWLNESLADLVDAYPTKLGTSPGDPVRLLYAGNIGNKQGLLEFCEQARSSSASFHLTVHGSGPGAEALHAWWDRHGDDRFEFGPFLPETAFIDALHRTDLFLITEREQSGSSYMPSKLIPAIASGTPVFAVSDPDSSLGCEMERSGLGPHLRWDELDELATVLKRSAEPEQYQAWQEHCLARATSFRRDVVIDQIEAQLEHLVAARKR